MTIAERVAEALATIRTRTAYLPRFALVLGSGLGSVAESLESATAISYEEIPHWPRSSAPGHAGRLVIGTMGGVPVVAMQGRVHFYEGYSMEQVTFPVRVFGAWGVKTFVPTNASGGVNFGFSSGDLVLIHDHINLMGANPLFGANVDEWGERFPDLSHAYDRQLMKIAERAALSEGIALKRGVYAAFSGPSFETPAEVRMARILGADLVGMSTVPEVIVARHMNLRVCALSCVANPAAGMIEGTLTHEEVLGEMAKAALSLARVLKAFVCEAAHV